MDGMLERLAEVLAQLSFAQPRIPIVSNLTGEPLSREQASEPRYWVDHARRTVRFADGIRWLGLQGVDDFLELGPDGILSAMCVACRSEDMDHEAAGNQEDPTSGAATGAGRPLTALPLLREGRPEERTLIGALAELWVKGVAVDWSALFEGSGARPVTLPTYAFQREALLA